MLQPQLKNICKRLRLEKYTVDKTTDGIIKKLDDYGMINREPWVLNRRVNFIKMRDPYIRECAKICEEFLGYDHSFDVITKQNDTKTRYDWSICKAEYVINMLNPKVKLSNSIYTVKDLILYLDKNNSMFYQKSRGADYIENFLKLHSSEYVITLKEKKDLKDYSSEFDRMLNKHCNISFISVRKENSNRRVYDKSAKDLKDAKIDVLSHQVCVTVRIDIFDTGDKLNIESLGKRIENIVCTLNDSLLNDGTLIDSCCKDCKQRCIECLNFSTKSYIKKISCNKEPFVLYRDLKYQINFYSNSDVSRDLLSSIANKPKGFRSGDKLDSTTLEFIIAENKNIFILDIQNKMTFNFKSFGIPVKYIKGKRGESLNDYNESRAIFNTPEFTTKTKDKVKRPDADTVNLVQILNKLPNDTREALVKGILNSLTENISNIVETEEDK